MAYRDALDIAKEQYEEAHAALAELDRPETNPSYYQLPKKMRREHEKLLSRIEPRGSELPHYTDATEAVRKCQDSTIFLADVLAQYQVERERKADRRSRRRNIRAALLIGGAVAVVAAVWQLPGRMIERGRTKADACLTHQREHLEGDTASCRQRVWLWPPQIFAWHRATARQLGADIERRIAEQELWYASRVSLDGAARDAAARQLAGDETATRDTAYLLRQSGAFAALTEAPRMLELAPELVHTAALLTGDLDLAHRAAAHPPVHRRGTARGAWLCLFGRQGEGLAVLHQYQAQKAVSTYVPRSTGLACGGTRSLLGFDPHAASFRDLRDRLALEPQWLAGRRASLGDLLATRGVVFNGAQHAEFAALIATTRERPLTEQLLWVVPAAERKVFPGRERIHPAAQSSGQLRDVDDVLLPELLKRGATHLEALAEAAEPLAEVPEGWTGPLAAEVAADPAGHLRHGAWAMRVYAARGYAMRRQTDRSLAAAARAEQRAPPGLRWMTAAVRHVAGDAEGAIALLAGVDDPLAKVEHALALCTLGRFEQARELARAACPDARCGAMAWLLVALDLQLGGTGQLAGLEPQSSAPKPGELGWWRQLAVMPRDERRRARATPITEKLPKEVAHVLAPALYLMSRAAGDDEDREVWLDLQLAVPWQRFKATPGLLALLRARAVVARWHGDDDSATRWRERHDELAKKIQDARTLHLATRAGL